ncbi:TPA: hypothetical protein GJ752_01270 [Legionella pneumophila]|nr:hypothetical protein [Legionella pneumophila]HAU0202966.1 hypothetical protein [Legionella pneumophila]HCJ4375600.1 hypothetical protein [Legionella pneumophila]HDO9951393.1 hypothetical protein [Legionella pneumophila]HDU8290476.1 hypothetical protein [Legionella pneumophila]
MLNNKENLLADLMTTIIGIIQDLENNIFKHSPAELHKKFVENNKVISEVYIKKLSPFFQKRGWYISGELYNNQIISLAKAIDNIDKTEHELEQEYAIEEALIGLVKQLLIKKENEMYSTWPHREKILKAAINAHKKSNYILSIPIFLAQSDGICHDIFGLHIFSQKQGKKLSEEIEKISNSKVNTSLMKAFLELLSKPSSMTSRTDKRDEQQQIDKLYGPVNRHGILHGIDLEYDNEANSLRCISLLFFLEFIQNSYLLD